MNITDAFLRNAVGKPYSGAPQIAYGKGLSIRISPKGKITWVLRYNFNGAPARVKLGEYPAMKIKEAQDQRDEYKALVSKGIDPRSDHIKLGVNSPKTISALIEYYVEHSLMETNKQWQSINSLLQRSVVPHIGDYKAGDIELSDYVRMFQIERERAGAKHATRLLYRLKSVLNYGIRHGFLKQNHLNHLKGRDVGEISKPVKRKLTEVEIGAMWVCIDTLPYHETMKNLLKLTMIFGSRISELRLSEKSHFDFDKMVWTVPVINNKMGSKLEAEITRPIPKMAESIIRQQIDIAPDFKYMFPRYYIVADKPIDQKTPYRPSLVLGQMMSGLGYTETRNHDMRRTARNAWEQLRFPPYVSETMLGHKVHKGVMAHYVDYDYLEEQRECYDIWCEYIQKKVSDFLSNQRHISQLGSAS
ncbi:tyrosine-type recombinase/integrase [Photobacterium indicum]|uniref:Integrase n=1 Tax=Photobacterium indicum TaxID=81447 RepID=A0A2T3LF29_9GAMM|nr:site-specific integrase [Photobacterium indicum]PSV49993.1 integrase [Photobacterium indicum]